MLLGAPADGERLGRRFAIVRLLERRDWQQQQQQQH
jgi:hypothetical protein